MTVRDIIKKKPYLIWYTKSYDSLSDEVVVEAVLNYGDWDDVQELIKILGIKKTAKIFRKQVDNWRSNYRPYDVYYFTLYFNKYDPIPVEPSRKGFEKLQKTKFIYSKLTGFQK